MQEQIVQLPPISTDYFTQAQPSVLVFRLLVHLTYTQIVAHRLPSCQEQEHFVQFLVALVEPSGGDSGKSFVPPHETFQAFILPHLSCPAALWLQLC